MKTKGRCEGREKRTWANIDNRDPAFKTNTDGRQGFGLVGANLVYEPRAGLGGSLGMNRGASEARWTRKRPAGPSRRVPCMWRR